MKGDYMHQPSIVLGEDYWQIDINLPLQGTETAAQKLANDECGNCRLVLVGDRPAIEVPLRGMPRLYFDEDVVITEISEDKVAAMGPPLDSRNPVDVKAAIQSLLTHDPAYIVSPEDMVPSGRDLQWFIERYGVGYCLDIIAYGVKKL
jgi:hypothetical protein